jgi:alpha-glucoside transport system permease protein
MSAEAAAPAQVSTAPRYSPAWLAERLQGAVLHIVVIGLTVAWMVPAIGLFISSFRPFTAINSSGWWAALSPPFQFTLDNYSSVLSSSNLGHSIFNSFMISIPATVIPTAVGGGGGDAGQGVVVSRAGGV